MIRNKRDLGGIRVAGGSAVRPGLLVRSASLSQACESDLAGISTIIDLRTSLERAEDPDLLFGRRYLPLPIFEDATAGISHEEGTDSQPRYDMAFLYAKAVRECSVSFRKVLLAIMEHDYTQGAVLWHCAGGKDRTGMIAAMILEALGAAREEIMEDYLKTNIGLREYLHLRPGEDLAGKADPAWVADESYLQAAWDEMGDNYLRDVLRIDAGIVSAFRKKVLS